MFLALLLILIGGGCLLWGSIPLERVTQEVVIPSEAIRIGPGDGEEVGLQEDRLIRLDAPKTLRIADKGEIRLDLIPIAQEEGLNNPVDIGNGSNSENNIVVEARIEISGAGVSGPNPAQESIQVGKPAHFRWKVTTLEPGIHPASAWLSVRYIPMDGSSSIQEPIYVKDINFTGISLLGMSGPVARLVGGGIVMIGIIVFISGGWGVLTKRI